MGLDMYLTAERYVSSYGEEDTAISQKVAQALGDVPGFSVCGVEIRVGYWRKANAIHKWFVDNVQQGVDECKAHHVTREDLQKLRETCLEVLGDPKKAEQMLPSAAGFFFGSTEYDEGYLQDLTHTVEVIDKALTLNPMDWYFKYQSSW